MCLSVSVHVCRKACAYGAWQFLCAQTFTGVQVGRVMVLPLATQAQAHDPVYVSRYSHIPVSVCPSTYVSWCVYVQVYGACWGKARNEQSRMHALLSSAPSSCAQVQHTVGLREHLCVCTGPGYPQANQSLPFCPPFQRD